MRHLRRRGEPLRHSWSPDVGELAWTLSDRLQLPDAFMPGKDVNPARFEGGVRRGEGDANARTQNLQRKLLPVCEPHTITIRSVL